MKWYSTEYTHYHEDYSVSDAMLHWAQSKGISVRGHNVHWDAKTYQPQWVPSLPRNQLNDAVWRRINSIMKRYSGQIIGWDVVNENIHRHFLEDRLGKSISIDLYRSARQLDQKTTLFLNDFNTIEDPSDKDGSPDKYLEKLKQIQNGGVSGPLGIGLEGHFEFVNLPYMRSSIDRMASSGLPIWITELDVSKNAGSNQAHYLEQALWEAHAHEAVKGIILWSAWNPSGCWSMCLTDNNFRNLPTGDVVDSFISKTSLSQGLSGTTDADGFFETLLYYGEYEIKFDDVNDMESSKSSFTKRFTVEELDSNQKNQQQLVKVIFM